MKCAPALICFLRQRPGFPPAYHMNKDRWVSILLDSA
ncbi:MmcQ/YjbR family DNA-binding protein [Oscillibacter hominis]|nr:MmcQ/YjbR family DNA-binding protein [Oscillibacter hominis]